MTLRTALLALFLIFATTGFNRGCGDNIDPSLSGENGTYALELSPQAYGIVYFYNGDFRFNPKLDFAKYWKAGELPHSLGEIRVRLREPTPKAAQVEKLMVTLPTADGKTQDIPLDLDLAKRRGTAQIGGWEYTPLAENCTKIVGEGIELIYSDADGDELTLMRETEWAYSAAGYPPTACYGPLALAANDLKKYTNPLTIPDPLFRIFFAVKLLTPELMEQMSLMKFKLIETGSRVAY